MMNTAFSRHGLWRSFLVEFIQAKRCPGRWKYSLVISSIFNNLALIFE